MIALHLPAITLAKPGSSRRARRRRQFIAVSISSVWLTGALACGGLGLFGCGGAGGNAAPSGPPPSSVTVSVSPGSASVEEGKTQPFSATVQGTSNTAVTWQVNGVTGGDSAHGTISTSGVYTAPLTLPSPASVTVTAVSQADSSKSGSSTVNITPALVTILISPTSISLTTQQSQAFTATVQTTASTAVSWSVDGIAGGNATVGPITAAGVYTAPSTAGTHNITATSLADPSKSATAVVTVTDFFGMFTQRYDNSRAGVNSKELALTPANVNATQFGKLFSCPIDGYAYAQPLYFANLSIPGKGTHNVVFVATEHDSMFAFDADNASCQLLWRTSFLINGATTPTSADVGTDDIVPEIGITGTPVIDPQTKTLYVVPKTKEDNGTTFMQRLHALDVTTGAEKPGSPAVIQATSPGTGDGNNGQGQIPFDSLTQLQRPALLLVTSSSTGKKTVYIAFASHGDNDPYHGWVLGYDAASLAQVAVFNDTPNGARGGIWMSGCGPAADSAGNLYVTTGNGTFDANSGGADFGDSFIRLSPANGLTEADYFTPFNQADLQANDTDLGAGGPLLLPDQAGVAHPHLMLSGGKEGVLYLVDRDSMGKFNPNDDSQIVESFQATSGQIFSTAAVWSNTVYLGPTNDSLKAFPIQAGKLLTSPSSQSSQTFSFPAGSPIVSASSTSNGIVWVLDSSQFASQQPAVLHAYDATDLSKELYNSAQAGSRDQAGPAVKFSMPTVANGKVYVGTENELTVFGLLPH